MSARLTLALVASLLLTASPAAHAQDGAQLADYDPLGKEWNGMSRWAALCSGSGLTVASVASLDWSELSEKDLLVLVYPLVRVEPDKLEAFISAGGHALIADDFGAAGDALAGLGLLRASEGLPRAARYYADRPFAPIAEVKQAHPLTEGVNEVITNHPAALRHPRGADEVIGFEDGALVVVGERGTGRFVAISDPSIFINGMLQFRGNLQLATNILRHLGRGGRIERVVLLRGEVPMYGSPRPFIDDARAGELGRDVADLNRWLDERSAWLLTPAAMRALAGALALLLLGLTFFALPLRRGPSIDGAWLRFSRPTRRDDPRELIQATDGGRDLLVAACLLRDQLQRILAEGLGRPEPLFGLSQSELTEAVRARYGAPAARQLSAIYRRIKALPSRGQAAAPWSEPRQLTRAEFDALHAAAQELCRSLGTEIA